MARGCALVQVMLCRRSCICPPLIIATQLTVLPLANCIGAGYGIGYIVSLQEVLDLQANHLCVFIRQFEVLEEYY